jgi:hypothetical protein
MKIRQNERPPTFPLGQDSLFKYCDGRGIDIFCSLRLNVSPPNQFNDPFEFLPKVDFSMDATHVKKWLTDSKVLQSAWEQSGGRTPLPDYVSTLTPDKVEDGRRVLQRQRLGISMV